MGEAFIVRKGGVVSETTAAPTITIVTETPDDVTGILSTDRPIVDLDLSGEDFADVADLQKEWAYVYRAAATDDDEMSFFATEKPDEDLVVQIKVVR